MRGIEFRRESDIVAPLKKLFNNINLDEYDWVVLENEIVRNNKDLYLPEEMDGTQFGELINNGQDDMIIFLNIQAYPKNSKHKEIPNFIDFVNSECEIIFLIVDLYEVEIYAKNKNLLFQFIENADQCSCTGIKIKTDIDDGRTRLSIW